MQTNVALTKGRREENSTDFTVNNSLIRRKTTYISIIGATKIYSFFNKNVLLVFFKTLKYLCYLTGVHAIFDHSVGAHLKSGARWNVTQHFYKRSVCALIRE